MALVRPLSMEAFEALVNHMQRCAREYREHVDQRLKLDVLAEVAISCDKDAVSAKVELRQIIFGVSLERSSC